MSFNPFNEKPMSFDRQVSDWKTEYPKPYDKADTDAHTKIRCILMNGTEFEAYGFQHHLNRHEANNDLRREIAAIRKIEQQQQKRLACLKPANETILEHTIGYEQLAVDLTATLAKSEKDPYVKAALDFALLEDFDHLYRYADLLDLENGIQAENLVNHYTEIMPARPTISEHRHPFDDVRYSINASADLLTKLNVNIIVAAEQQTMNYYANQAGFYFSDRGRRLYQEIGIIEEQHVTHYGSLLDPNIPLLDCLLMHEYTECYLYYSCYKSETHPGIKNIWEMHLCQEIAHLHKAAELLKKFGGKEWQQVIPDGNFPMLLSLAPQKDYIRKVIDTTVCLTSDRENYIPVEKCSPKCDYVKYQELVNCDVNAVPSHMVIKDHIDEKGTDYRYEIEESPIEELRCRKCDNTTLARPKCCCGENFGCK